MKPLRIVSILATLAILLALLPGAALADNLESTYVVRRGDTLAKIAAANGTTVLALMRANGISNANRIYTGQRLTIPNKSGASSGGGSTSTGQGTRFVTSISKQHCWLYVNGVLTGDWRCSTGRYGAPTVPGTYRVQSKIRNAYGSAWDFYMPYWLGIYWAGHVENGIHGLPYNPKTGRYTWAGMVGTRITFGCVMLDDVNAARLWSVAYIGMPVIVQR
jgi:LysM repeat protein